MLSILKSVQEYVQAMLGKVGGMKVLVVDEQTMGVVSMVLTQSEILEREVFLVERIDSAVTEPMRHLNAVYFVRPTNQNFLLLSQELKNPQFAEYHVFFTNLVPPQRLEQLAACDEFELVAEVQEYFADVFAIHDELFSLNMLSTVGLTADHTSWSAYEEALFSRIVEGLLGAALALRMTPVIRYARHSALCWKIALEVQKRMDQERQLFDASQDGHSVLLILDRRDDPVTPLLNQWTYQAMVHELLGLDNNRVDLRKAPGVKSEQQEQVLSSTSDAFFADNMYSNFGDLGANIKEYVDKFQEKTKTTAKLESVEDMRRFIDDYPEFQHLSGNVSKHVAMVHELSRLVTQGDLLALSALEQDLACSDSRTEHAKQVQDKVADPKCGQLEKLRLVLLFALRYEYAQQEIVGLKGSLRSAGIQEEQVQLVDMLLMYAGSQVRQEDLFQNKSVFSIAKNTFDRTIKGVENVYTQHKSLLSSTVDALMKGRLREPLYPAVQGGSRPVQQAVVFVVGGATYEEARDVAQINAGLEQQRVVLGGTTLHNSRSFLADTAQLVRLNNRPRGLD